MHTHSHTHAHTLTYTCTHTHIHMHTHSHTHAHTLTYTCTHTHIHMHTHSHTHAHTLTYTCTHTHIHMHTHSHTHAHTLTYTCTQIPKEIGQLRTLSCLDISHNDIRHLPDEMGHLDHLFLLNLQGLNKLSLDPSLLKGPTKNITAFLKSRRVKVCAKGLFQHSLCIPP